MNVDGETDRVVALGSIVGKYRTEKAAIIITTITATPMMKANFFLLKVIKYIAYHYFKITIT